MMKIPGYVVVSEPDYVAICEILTKLQSRGIVDHVFIDTLVNNWLEIEQDSVVE
jgi:hypothetical protein